MGKITVLCHENILWHNNGYHFAFGFYKFLSNYYKIKVIVPRWVPFFKEVVIRINRNLSVQIVTSDEKFLSEHLKVQGLFDFAECAHESSNLIEKIQAIVDESQVVICDTFIWAKFVTTVFPNKTMILRSLDVEQDKVDQAYASTISVKNESQMQREHFRDKIVKLERLAYQRAKHCWVLTMEDGKRLSDLYQLPLSKFSLLPLCVEGIGLYQGFYPVLHKPPKNSLNVVFIGFLVDDAWGYLNVILTAADKLPSVNFHIVGKQICQKMKTHRKNVIIYGEVDEMKKREIILMCDCALNLSTQTYGMNTKLLDYMLLGCPIISTRIGVRGYSMEEWIHYLPCEREFLSDSIIEFMGISEKERNEMAYCAFRLLFERHDYKLYLSNVMTVLKYVKGKRKIEREACFIVFGCGSVGKKALQYLKDREKRCIGMTDNNRALFGTKMVGNEVISPKEAFRLVNENEAIEIIIATDIPYFLKEMYLQAYMNISDKTKINIYCYDEMNSESIDVSKILNEVRDDC